MAGYRQPTYEVPYSGLVPGGGAIGMSDEFRSGAQLESAPGVPVPGYMLLDTKWNVSGRVRSVVTPPPLAAINAPLSRAELQCMAPGTEGGGTGASWMLQNLPIGAELAVYGSSSLATMVLPGYVSVDGWNLTEPPQSIAHGLLAGWSGTNPMDGGYYLLGQEVTFDPDTWEPSYSSGIYAIDEDAKLSPYWVIPGVAAPYYRVRLRQVETSPGSDLYTVWNSFEISFTGADWLPLQQYELTEDDENPLRSVGFFVQAGNMGELSTENLTAGAYFDFFRVYEQQWTDLTTRIGGPQQLGAV